MADIRKEIERRRTFAIISHPDAGKTTLTEKLLLYGGAIQLAGSVKGKATARHAVSDWMELEKQRGISISSSVMQFEYNGYCINILDTPGHQDFSEDTYRTLMAADSAVMVIDAAKGIEPQTRKLFKICAMRNIPIFTFINKLDREARSPYDLMEELEQEFGIGTYPMNWPIGCGIDFKGVYDREKREILAFNEFHRGQDKIKAIECSLDDTETLDSLIGEKLRRTLCDDVELLDGAGYEFDIEQVRDGKLSPVFFGSALNNFGIEPFLESFLDMTMPPLPRKAGDEIVDPFTDKFSAFVFKIQANMNKAHRDRLAFMRICSGKFQRDTEYYHVRTGRKMRLSQPQQLMAAEREIVEEAYAGDVIGVFDSGMFAIGDTITTAGKKFAFSGIPTFAPEHFSRVSAKDSMKRKQFVKGTEQIAQEGAIQIFKVPNSGMEEVIVGVVGTLQFDVFQYRMKSEYGVDLRMESLPYEEIRLIESYPGNLTDLNLGSDAELLEDYLGRSLLVFSSYWAIDFTCRKNPGLKLREIVVEEG